MDKDIRLRPRERGRRSGGTMRVALTIVSVLGVVALCWWGVSAALGARGTDAASKGADATAAHAPTSATSAVVPTAGPDSTEASAAAVATDAADSEPTPAPSTEAPAASAQVRPPVAPRASGFTVVIDAGHQGKGDNTPEPIGPGSRIKKPAVAGGTSGVVTRVRESVVNLQVALKLRTALQTRGIRVIMIRTTESVDIANSKRAKIANAAHAGLLIRLHCDGVDSSSVAGLLTLVPAKNAWTGPIVSSSARAGRDIHAATLASTGAHDRGITPRSDMSGFNWATVPSVIVEMGVMTNGAEDRKLSTQAYQAKLAAGMAAGIARFAAGK